MRQLSTVTLGVMAIALFHFTQRASAGESWPQLKFDGRHSGNVPERELAVPLGLVGAIPLTDAVFTSPVVAAGRVYVVDGSGVVFCVDTNTLRVVWRVKTRGGQRNCNNVSSPALCGGYLHFGTTAGVYYVVDAASGKIVEEIDCGEPIFSCPVVGKDRVYFATLGSQVYALTPGGEVCWTWDFVKEQLGFSGDRWSGAAWAEHLKGRVTGKEQFLCSRDIALDGNTLVIPAGGSIVWLADDGPAARLHRLHRPHTATFGLSIGADGAVYRQSHWLDNGGQVEILRGRDTDFETAISRSDKPAGELVGMIDRAFASAKAGVDYVPGTKTSTDGGLLSFSSVSLRGQDVYRCRPEEGFGLCRHSPGRELLAYPGCYPAISSPVLLRDKAVYGGLDGALYVAPLAGGEAWSFKSPFGKAISSPAAVCDGRIYFGCEDGYLYVLGSGGNAPLPTEDLKLWKIRTPLAGKWADPKYDRFTSFADWGNTNASPEQLQLPLRVDWIRRFEGSAKHFSSCGGGRMYTHTAEGQVFAVEQATGRQLWRRYFPGVHICYTTPLYHQERVLVAQAGRTVCRLRCLDAATGELLWEAPFAGSPSWGRQLPPVVYRNLAIYMFGTGRYDDDTPAEEKVRWLWDHGGVNSYPPSHHPMLRAYDLATGKEAWARDFAEFGSGGDESGICLTGDTLYYSCFFGYAAERRAGSPGLHGITAAIEPRSGRSIWLSTEQSIRSGCTISGAEGRLYVGGYCADAETGRPHVSCLDAKDGSLVWRSEPLPTSIHVVAIAPAFLFVHTHGSKNFLLDKQTGKTLAKFEIDGYRCSRLTLTGRYLLGPNLDVIDLGNPQDVKLLSTGPRLDPSECIGATASNGRVFYTGHGGGLQVSLAPPADTIVAKKAQVE
ncbi:MAG: PQQ-binding-like beta-propeller repeat protein [Thermoguttaceae bacterium]|jgi:outer membrane protein assembly factor BamB